ncbi:MAG: alginate export family protein [Deltaproteobacteria bacterium]|nr:alginate export family protein [Deltaproteobacteria bacterium]
MRSPLIPLLLGLAALLGAVPVMATESEDPPATFLEALKGGNASLSLRYRFENVDQEPFSKKARASTLRTTLGYRTAFFRGFRLFVEAENVTEVAGEGLFNNRGAGSLGNGVTDRPVVADPEDTEIHQVGLRFEAGETAVVLGRQEIAWADQRFVGPVGWRQNHQAFDAVFVKAKPFQALEVTYAYLDRVHRVFGDHKPMASHGLSGELSLPFGKLRGYGLYLDYDRLSDAGLSTSTYGLELSGAHDLGSTKILFELEAAQQRDAGDNPNEVDAGYLHAMVGAKAAGWIFKGGFERLEGSAGEGRFTTPLATLHKWNGWADKFLGTPVAGLEDLYFEAGGGAGAFAWKGVFHDFSAESGGGDYGSEIDFQFSYRSPWSQVFGLKAAFYEEDGFSSDTDKLWFWTSYSF